MQWQECARANLLPNRLTSHFVACVLSNFASEKQRHFDFQAKTFRQHLLTEGLFYQFNTSVLSFYKEMKTSVTCLSCIITNALDVVFQENSTFLELSMAFVYTLWLLINRF